MSPRNWGSDQRFRKAAGPRPLVERSKWPPTRAVRGSIATEPKVANAGGLGQVQRDRVVGAQHPAAALQRVLTQGAGRLRRAQQDQRERQGGRRPQGGGVVGAQHSAAALYGVLAQDPA